MTVPPRLVYPACCAAAVLAVIAAYGNHFHNSFHFDDSHAVENNVFIRDLRNLPRIFTDAQTFSALPTNQSYRPLVTATLALDYRLAGGLDTFWFQLDSFAFFLLQCGLMLWLFHRILGSRWLALFGATLYGLHTAIAETVNYVIARGDILSTLGAVAAVALYARGGRARRYWLYLIPMALGVFAKEQGAMAAPLLLLYVGLIEEKRSIPELLRARHFGAALRATLPAFVLCAAIGVLTLKMATNFSPGGTSRLDYLLTQPYVLFRYVTTFLLPIGLSADTDWGPVSSLADARVAIGLVFVIAALVLAVRASREEKTRPIAFGVLWFFVALLPTSSLVPLSEVTNDHRLYFPYVGLALAAACGAGLLLERFAPILPKAPWARALPAGLAVLLFSAHALGVRARNQVWRTEETLWKDVTEKSPANGRAWMNYGITRMAKGDFDEAERCFRRGLQLAPYYGYLHTNLAVAEAARGRAESAEREFKEGIRLMPGVPSLRYYYARFLLAGNRQAEAAPLLREVLVMSPADSPARLLLLQTLAKMGAWTELREAADEALQIRADDPAARSFAELARRAPEVPPADLAVTPDELLQLSLRLYQQARYAESIKACDRALALQPAFAEAWNNKCAALNKLRRSGEAAAACEAALRIKPDFQLAKNNLAEARAGR